MDEKETRRIGQREVAREGRQTEDSVMKLILSDNQLKERLYVGRIIYWRKDSTYRFLDYVTKEKFLVDCQPLLTEYETFDGRKLFYLIDSDIVLLSKQQRKVVCVISVKKTFRERYSQSAYWALKSKERTFEYILATPDVDREIFDPDNPERYTKARSILENEMNAVFVLRDDLKCGEYGKLFVGKSLFIEYLRKMKFV